MTEQRPTENNSQSIAQAIQEVSERAQVLVREEIELAKTEISEKVAKLVKGAVVGLAAGIFVVCGLLFVLHGLAWLAWYELFPDWQFFWGFFVVAGVLFVLGVLAGFMAARAFKAGAPPTPELAIDEAKRIRDTVQSPQPEQTV
ncbi:MAG TPA: phage holin family protein [Solirubrobacteraceae bacterium]